MLLIKVIAVLFLNIASMIFLNYCIISNFGPFKFDFEQWVFPWLCKQDKGDTGSLMDFVSIMFLCDIIDKSYIGFIFFFYCIRNKTNSFVHKPSNEANNTFFQNLNFRKEKTCTTVSCSVLKSIVLLLLYNLTRYPHLIAMDANFD